MMTHSSEPVSGDKETPPVPEPSFPFAKQFVPAGHFYSPIPALDEIEKHREKIFSPTPARVLPGINLNEEGQLRFLKSLVPYYKDLPFRESPQEHLRYSFDNPHYSYSDAILCYSMLRLLKPRRIVEVGSGYSSALMLDTSDLFLGGKTRFTFIDPYPETLLQILRPGDKDLCTLWAKPLQEAPPAFFQALEAGDILFIDSTHVSKIYSDVNFLLFQFLPLLKKGVYIHFHDIFFPFEYPQEWIWEGRSWNEIYLLRAFLQYNNAFEIVLFNTFLEHFHEEKFKKWLPLCLKNKGGSLWLKKLEG